MSQQTFVGPITTVRVPKLESSTTGQQVFITVEVAPTKAAHRRARGLPAPASTVALATVSFSGLAIVEYQLSKLAADGERLVRVELSAQSATLTLPSP